MLNSLRMLMFLPVLAMTLGLGYIGPQAVSAADALTPIDLGQIRIDGEIGRRIDITINNNLLLLDLEKDFLAPFRNKTAHGDYVGLGKLIDAAVRFAAYSKNEKVIALKNHLVAETIKSQESDGYIGMMAAPARMWSLWDIHEMGYIIYGLTSDYRYFGNKASLDAAKKAADYILQRWPTMPTGWTEQSQKIATHLAVIGLERAFLTLYRETNDPRYLDFCTRERGLADWDLGIVIGRRELAEGHVYAYLARCLAQFELYSLQPDERLLHQTERAMHFMSAEDGMTITGGVGQREIWTNDQDGRGDLGETCATAYQLRIYNRLMQLEGNSHYGDLIERTIYNALFGAQSPDGRKIRYYTPFESERTYHPSDTYCCPCNFRRIIAELPTMVYYRAGAGVAVNLYTPSKATIPLADGASLQIRQETEYPTSGQVSIHLDPSVPSSFPLKLRIPRWCGKDVAVTVNGNVWKGPISAGAFLTIERTWKAGDQVTLEMPMPWRLVLGRKRQSGRVAVMRGPVVFCLNPAQNESLRKQDAADLTGIMIDPSSLKELVGGNWISPGDVACQVRAGNDHSALGVSGELSLRFTEFPDPEGKAIYFRVPDLSVAVPDELLDAK